MSRARPLGGRHVVAVALGLPLGAGVFSLPRGVENLGGPATPLAYLAATLVVFALALPYAAFLSSPLADRPGLGYAAVSRTWGSRTVGFLAVWPALGAYVAVLAALAAGVGALLAEGVPLSPTALALLVLGAVVAIHARGAATAGRAQVWFTGTLLAFLLVLLVAGLTAVSLDNFSPLLPTPPLRERPVLALGAAATTALFGFVGFEAGAAVATDARDAARTVPRALFAGVLVAGVVVTCASLVTLGVIPWSRLVFASAPFADAAAAALGVDPRLLLVPGSLLATAGAALATAWLPTDALRGVAEVVPGVDRPIRPGLPDPALALPALLAAVVVALDAVGQALYLALAGIVLQYAAVGVSAAALPLLRPALYERCRLRPPPWLLVGVSLFAVAASAVLLGRVLTRDPSATLAVTRWAPALSTVDEAVLVRDPSTTVVPALVGWELVGVAVVAIAADYRADRGVELPPLADAYEGGE